MYSFFISGSLSVILVTTSFFLVNEGLLWHGDDLYGLMLPWTRYVRRRRHGSSELGAAAGSWWIFGQRLTDESNDLGAMTDSSFEATERHGLVSTNDLLELLVTMASSWRLAPFRGSSCNFPRDTCREIRTTCRLHFRILEVGGFLISSRQIQISVSRFPLNGRHAITGQNSIIILTANHL